MTTNTTNSQAASIDTPEFRIRLSAVSWESRSAPSEAFEDVMNRLITYIDAKLAQARQGALSEADIVHKDLLATMAESGKIWQHRATAAEAQLDAIREGIKLLQQYWVWDGHLCETQNQHPERAVVRLDKVLALLAPQAQADTSGLPG